MLNKFICHLYRMAEMGMYVLTSLLGAGVLLNNRKQQRDTRSSNIKTQEQPVVGTNVYNSRDYFKNRRHEEKLVKKNWEAAKNPIETGVIPMYYNTLHIKGDSEKVPNNDYQSKLIYNIVKHLDPEAQKLVKEHQGSAIHDIDREVKPDWGIVMDRPRTEPSKTDDPVNQIGGSLLGPGGTEDFTHNNMVPFYKGNITQDMRLNSRAKEGKLELYTGQFKLNRPQKQECGMLFQPVSGLTNIYGQREQRDITRYNPNNTGKKNNELPFEQTTVGPGLNKGFTDKPSGGFHETLRIMPKGIEQLRVDPVLETEGRVKAGKALNSKRTLTSQMYRNRPELLVENKKGERNFTTVGAVRGRTLRPTVVLKDTNRKKSRFLITPAKAAQGGKSRVAPKTRASHKQSFCNTSYRNATSNTKRHNDYGKSGYQNRLNNRAITGTKTHIIAPKGEIAKHKRRLYDKARKTRKQHYIHHSRTYGYAGPQQPNAGPSYNPNEWAAKTTIRETTENNNHQGNVGAVYGQQNPSYNPDEWKAKTTIRETTEDNNHQGNVGAVYGQQNPSYIPDDWKARTTIRETTETNDHQGNVGAVYGHQAPAYNPDEWVTRTTIRETTENNNHVGIHSGLRKKHIAYDPNDRARTTIRETTENNNHLGAHSGIRRKHIVYDPNDRARTTIRETTEDNKHLGVAAGQKKHKAYDPNDRARTTIRETTEDSKYIGGVGNVHTQSGKGYMTTNVEAKNTNRQFTSDNDYTGIANANSKKTRSYTDAYNARTNENKERVAKGRCPMGGGPRLGHQEINIEVKKMDEDRVNQYAVMKTSTIGNTFNPGAHSLMTVTSERNYLPQDDIRLDADLLEAYKRNPLTHSLQSWA
jgi:ribosomal protein L21E